MVWVFINIELLKFLLTFTKFSWTSVLICFMASSSLLGNVNLAVLSNLSFLAILLGRRSRELLFPYHEKRKSESQSTQSCLTLCDTMDCSLLDYMEFSRQEYSSRFPFPSPGDLPKSGVELRSPALQADSLPSELPGKSSCCKQIKCCSSCLQE